MADLAKNQTHVVLVNGIVEKDGKLLISQRSFEESHMPGLWTIPGGKVDQTGGDFWGIIEHTLAKEVKEETGVDIEEHVQLISNNTFIRSTGHHVIALNFLCKWKSGIAEPLEDTIAVAWVSGAEIDKYKLCPGVDKYLKSAFDYLK